MSNADNPANKAGHNGASRADAVLARIAERRPKLIDLGLDRMRATLRRLGDPHLRLPPTIHVAGTNGKGSVVAYARSMLEAAGLRAHVFTSPHLVRFNERIVLGGAEISDDDLCAALIACDEAAGDAPLTYFEATTCAAFLAFAEHSADALVLEVGLGGRLDSTNVIEGPAAAAVSPVALDHQDFLGTDIASIAKEKAGIFKRGAPAVIGRQAPAALEVLEAAANVAGARPYVLGRDWSVRPELGRLVFEDESGLRDLALPRLVGAHQIENAGLAIAAVTAAGFPVDDEALSEGLASADWPARMQRLRSGPLLEAAARRLGEEAEIWLDGGHNPHAAQAIARAFADIDERAEKPLILIIGMQDNKDADGYFQAFADLGAAVFTVAAGKGSPMDPAGLARTAQEAGLPAVAMDSLTAAVERACGAGGPAPRILIGGSLYLAGEVLADHE